MFLNSFIQMLPILIIAAAGYFGGKLLKIDNRSLVTLVSDFFMPMLIFHSIYFSDLSGSLMLDLTGIVTLIIIIQTALAYLYARMAKIDARGFVPPNIFMNAGFLGIPLMKLWGGTEAMNIIVVFDQVQTIYIFTLGLLIITGGLSAKSLANMLKAPLLWAIFAGFACKMLGLNIWEPLLTTFEFAGNAGPPLAAFILGSSMSLESVRINRHVMAGVCIRMFVGYGLGLLAVLLFGMTGTARTVVLVASALPAAVFSSILPMRYGVQSAYAVPIVVLSTLISVITIPLTFMLAG